MDSGITQRSNPGLAAAQTALEEAGIQNAYMEVRWLLAAVLHIRPSILYASPELEITEEKQALFQGYLRERVRGRPLAYILGEQPFYELDFFVNESVLIPRPETEELVGFCIEGCEPNLAGNPIAIPPIPQNGSMLDLGTGSGCIGLSLLYARPKWKLLLSDISEEALAVAEKNAKRHFPHLQARRLQNTSEIASVFACQKPSSVQTDICLIASDLYQNIPEAPLFDLIVSNPPYIHPDESDSLDHSVKDFEPRQALFCDDPMGLYTALLCGARGRLRKRGIFLAELSPRWAEPVGKLAQALFSEAAILKDSAGKDRFVYGRIP